MGLLSLIGDGRILQHDSPDVSMATCSFDPSLTLVSSTDFFTPVSQNPYIQGRIAIANVLSDIYAVGVTRIDTVLMILTVSTVIPEECRDVVTSEMIRGYNDGCSEAGVICSGGQTIFNPWPLIGGTASAVTKGEMIVRADNLQSGDVLVLTKPLGTQIVGNLALWLLDDSRWTEVVSKLIDEETARRAVRMGEESMMRLNKNAALVMREVGAHGCTDVTGFGILGHAENLVNIQKNPVDIVLTHLPIIRGLVQLEKSVTIDYRLTRGYSAETSGGLLIAMSEAKFAEFKERMIHLGEPEVWIVGRVVNGQRKAHILPAEDLLIIEI